MDPSLQIFTLIVGANDRDRAIDIADAVKMPKPHLVGGKFSMLILPDVSTVLFVCTDRASFNRFSAAINLASPTIQVFSDVLRCSTDWDDLSQRGRARSKSRGRAFRDDGPSFSRGLPLPSHSVPAPPVGDGRPRERRSRSRGSSSREPRSVAVHANNNNNNRPVAPQTGLAKNDKRPLPVSKPDRAISAAPAELPTGVFPEIRNMSQLDPAQTMFYTGTSKDGIAADRASILRYLESEKCKCKVGFMTFAKQGKLRRVFVIETPAAVAHLSVGTQFRSQVAGNVLNLIPMTLDSTSAEWLRVGNNGV